MLMKYFNAIVRMKASKQAYIFLQLLSVYFFFLIKISNNKNQVFELKGCKMKRLTKIKELAAGVYYFKGESAQTALIS